ncbi:MAG: hypothetical protein KAY20_02790 [Brevundimonas sp.]|nr:hypothetical protein [Brevundimonas sp.]
MRGIAAIVIAGFLGGATPGLAQEAETDVAAFLRLRAEGVAAANAEDLATASARLAEADARIPNHPGLMLMRARLAVAASQPAEAMIQLRRYAAAGLVIDLAADRALSTLADQPGFAELAAGLATNRAAIGADRLSPLFEIAGPHLSEAVVRDEARSRWLVSQVSDRTIVAVDDTGRITPFLKAPPETGGVLGMAIDPERGLLWAAIAPLPPAVHGAGPEASLPGTALIRVELESGRIGAWFDPPAGPAERALGDVLLATNGDAYVSDSAAGEILVVRPGGGPMDVLLSTGTLRSPQGLVATPDGRGLIVADYSSGLWRVDRETGAAERLPAPDDASLIGVDGMTTDGRFLYGFQNGVAPQRVLKLTPDAGWTAILSVEVLAANLPMIDEPTTGLVRNRELVFVSRSQWSDFGGDGAETTPTPAPAIIARLPLD